MTGHFSVKNFERYQHYKDRAPPWIKLYNTLLDDYEFGNMPDASKAHLLAIMLLASRYDNSIPYDAEWISRRINATDPVDLSVLEKHGFIVLDQGCSNMLADCKQDAIPETERETERETEKIISSKNIKKEFEEHFWPPWPHKVDKAKALEVFIRTRKAGTTLQTLTDAIPRYISSKPDWQDFMGPAKWLRNERWEDSPGTGANGASPTPKADTERMLADHRKRMIEQGIMPA